MVINVHKIRDCKLKQYKIKYIINIPMKVCTYRNAFIIGSPSQNQSKIANSEDILKYKISRSDFSKTWREKRQKLVYMKGQYLVQSLVCHMV